MGSPGGSESVVCGVVFMFLTVVNVTATSYTRRGRSTGEGRPGGGILVACFSTAKAATNTTRGLSGIANKRLCRVAPTRPCAGTSLG